MHAPARLLLAAFFLAGAALLGAANAQSIYRFDQRQGTIEFTVDNLGMFTSHGRFKSFRATLKIDPARPEATSVVAEVDAASVDADWPEGVEMLRSPDYFDVQRYPEIQFRSTGVASNGPDRYAMRGLLQIRGITRPFTLDARLVSRTPDGHGGEIADFVAKGQLNRSEFGMTSDRNLISDHVDLTISVRIKLVGAA